MSTSGKDFDLDRVRALVDSGAAEPLEAYLDEIAPQERARLLTRLDEGYRGRLLGTLRAGYAGDLFEALGEAQSVDLLEEIDPAVAAAIVDELPSNEQADLLAEVEDETAARILDAMSGEEARDARALMQYPWDSAGGMMVTEFLAFPLGITIGQLLEDLRTNREAYADYNIQYVYLVNDDGTLAGVVRLRDLLLARPGDPIQSVMVPDPLNVRADAQLPELYALFHANSFVGLPVVDGDNRLIGVLSRSAVEEAAGEQATDTFLKITGLRGEEEIRSMPMIERSLRRLAWLSINIVLNIAAASVIAFNQATLEQVIALAVFLPIISDMSGNAGNQAVSVSIRELSLGLVKQNEFRRVFCKEAGVGLINGFVLGLLVAVAGGLWQADLLFGVVVGTALMLNTILSVLIGGLIPLVLKSLKLDPALASGPILTTLTDMFGFFFVLFFASRLLVA